MESKGERDSIDFYMLLCVCIIVLKIGFTEGTGFLAGDLKLKSSSICLSRKRQVQADGIYIGQCF